MDLKVPKLPKIAIGWRKALIAAGVAAAALLLVFVGWTLFIDYTEERQVAVFGSHVAASEADLFLVSGKVSSHMRSRPEYPSVAESDAVMREFAAIAEYGRGVAAYHRQIVGADEVPEAYVEAQSAYIRALDHLNRAFSLWSSAAGAYDAKAYAAAGDHLAGADRAWKDYTAAIDEYDRELRIAEEGGEIPPA
ncbi:MAG: hypothetical protein M0P22_02505 [Methanoculleus sp.]|nr:hypothetical protein [Methanoculleus sp.]